VQSKLSLVANIQSFVGCRSNWTVVELPSFYSLASGVSFIPANKFTNVYIQLEPRTLMATKSYSFIFRCQRMSSEISIIPNTPPEKGNFTIIPLSGYEITTLFNFVARSWMDEDLPLEYQFGFMSFGNELLLQAKSEIALASSILPSGLVNHSTTTKLEVFDALSASSFRIYGITLKPTDSSAASNYIESIVSTSMSSTDINMVGSILNAVNCSGVINCNKVNRHGCSDVDFSCGPCLEGFIGESGSKNSLCVYHPLISSTPKTVLITYKCKSDNDCDLFQYCDSSGSCGKMPKQCPNSCSNQGDCSFINSNTGLQVSKCDMTSSDCQAVCQCIAGFGGASCALSSAQVQQKIILRQKMLVSFNNQTTKSASPQEVISRASTLSSITQKVDELGAEAVRPVFSAVGDILQSALVIGVGYEKLGGVLQSVDNVASVSSGDGTIQMLTPLLTQFVSITASQLFPGERAVENILSNIRSVTKCIDESKSTVDISVPKSSYEELFQADKPKSAVRLVHNSSESNPLRISLIEVSAKLLAESNYSVLSNPLTLHISNIRGVSITNMSTNVPSFVVVLRNILNSPASILQSFSTVCNSKFNSLTFTANYTCPDSGHVLIHNCTNKIGTFKSYCPVYKPSCREIMKNGRYQSQSCQLLNHSQTETICECKISSTISSKHERRFLNDESSVAEESGAMQLVAISEYVTIDALDTFTAASSLNSATSAEKVVTVMLLFAAVWMLGFGVVASSCWRIANSKRQTIKVAELFRHQRRVAETSQSTAAVREYISSYILQTIPAVFRGRSKFHQYVDEIAKFHRYFVLLKYSNPDQKFHVFRIMTALELASTNYMLFFLLALFYHLQSPADDGTCLNWEREQSCLDRKSPLDPYQSYCSWSTQDGCAYQTPVFTTRMILAMTMLISVTTAVFLRPMGYLFGLLSAPMNNSNRSNNEAAGVGNSTAIPVKRTRSVLRNGTAVSTPTRKIIGIETRSIPNDANNAQEVAHVSASLIAARANSFLHHHYLDAAATLFKLRREETDLGDCSHEDINSESSDEFASVSISIAGSRQESVDAINNANEYVMATATQNKLLESIRFQRKILRSTSILEEFDIQWGIDAIATDAHDGILYFHPLVQKKLFAAIDNVTILAERKIEMLKLVSDKLTGIEIIHFFIADLLGSTTAAAKIFEQIIKEEFKRTQIVTLSTKCIAGIILISMNIFFAYYSVLFGFTQGIVWQRQYVFACVVQMIVEVFINETLEVTWMHFCVPSIVVSSEMQKAIALIEEVIDRICAFSPQSLKDEVPCLINAPEYLFISTRVAKSFPHLMESIFVRAFITHLPGTISKLWMDRTWFSDIKLALVRTRGTRTMRIASAVTMVLATVAENVIGAAPFELQRMTIRFLQPFFLSGIIILYVMVVDSTFNISLFVGILCAVMAYVVVRYVRDGITTRNHQQIIRPVHTSDEEFTTEPIIDFTSNQKDTSSSINMDSINFSEISVCCSSDDYKSVSSDGNEACDKESILEE